MPGCNGRDKVKAHQDEGNGKQLDLRIRGDVRQGLSLNRPRIPQGNEEEELVQVPESGKPDAMKVARPVWNGGKAARPYLSLREVQSLKASAWARSLPSVPQGPRSFPPGGP